MAGPHQREVTALLGDDFTGIACSDRWRAYDYLDPEQRQLCWAHLVRDFTAHSEGLAAQKRFGEAGLALTARLFAARDAYRDHGDRARLFEQIAPGTAFLWPARSTSSVQATRVGSHWRITGERLRRLLKTAAPSRQKTISTPMVCEAA